MNICTVHCIKSSPLALWVFISILLRTLLTASPDYTYNYIINMSNVQKSGSACTKIHKIKFVNLVNIAKSKWQKKNKVFVSPNRFALLATEDQRHSNCDALNQPLKEWSYELALYLTKDGTSSSTCPHRDHFKLHCFQ